MYSCITYTYVLSQVLGVVLEKRGYRVSGRSSRRINRFYDHFKKGAKIVSQMLGLGRRLLDKVKRKDGWMDGHTSRSLVTRRITKEPLLHQLVINYKDVFKYPTGFWPELSVRLLAY